MPQFEGNSGGLAIAQERRQRDRRLCLVRPGKRPTSSFSTRTFVVAVGVMLSSGGRLKYTNEKVQVLRNSKFTDHAFCEYLCNEVTLLGLFPSIILRSEARTEAAEVYTSIPKHGALLHQAEPVAAPLKSCGAQRLLYEGSLSRRSATALQVKADHAAGIFSKSGISHCFVHIACPCLGCIRVLGH